MPDSVPIRSHRPPLRTSKQTIIKTFSQSKTSALAPRMTVESGKYSFHYLLSTGVCYLTLVEKGYPKKLAYQYLEELQREFSSLYHSEIESVARPYAFIKFGEWCGARSGTQARVR